ncbi:MAG: EamA family transporter [Planctomycetes bacterium]|nr:EamA family transporter [Planctomycetota bacterium]MCW8137198.1 EamA family transporter [Planctomycetota bacterium]
MLALTRDAQGIAAALGTAFCWAFTAMFFAAAARRVGQFHVNQIRLVMACLLLGAACAIAGVYVMAPWPQMILLALSGLVGLTLGDAAGFQALQILGPRRATLLWALAPGFAALLMIPLLDETLGWVGVVGMAITLAGVMWVVLERSQPGEIQGNALWGIVMGILGALGQAGGLILSKAGLGMADPTGWLNEVAGVSADNVLPVSPLFGTFVRMVAGMALLVGYGVIIGQLPKTLAAMRNRKAMAQTAGGAMFGPFVGVTLSLAAVSLTNTAVAATVMSISPVLVIVIVRIVYKEKITARAVVGALVAVGGVAVLALRRDIAAMLA